MPNLKKRQLALLVTTKFHFRLANQSRLFQCADAQQNENARVIGSFELLS